MDTNQTGNNYFLPIAVILAGLLIAGAVVWNNSRPAGTAGPEAPKVNIKDVKIDGDPFIGASNAPVTIAFWSDFQCPFCKKFEVETLPQLVTDYVDTGKVKLVFMDFAFLGSDSIDAGVYSRAIWNLYPDKYYAWRTAMYEAQDEEGDQGFGDAKSIDKLNVTIVGIDAAKVAADVKVNRSAYEVQMNSDKAEAQKAGVNATPSFVIGTQVIQGAYPYPTFQSAIDALLK
ncbi:MAG TPA: thioredoxin domain-containing protein [Candidatus Paceibacterota bacterium]